MGLPGYGDIATWPPCGGHPNDPRTVDDEEEYFEEITKEEEEENAIEMVYLPR